VAGARAEPLFRPGARQVFWTLLVGYAAFYLCRANVDAAAPLLEKAFGYDKVRLGALSSLGTIAYAIGKVTLGPLGDRLGGRRIFLLCLFGSVVASLTIGAVAGAFSLLLGVVVLNRFAQSGGWGGLVNVVSKWFRRDHYGTVMGGLSTSYELGNVCALVLSGVIGARFGWRALFLVNPLLLALVGVVAFFTLEGRPATEEVQAEAASTEDRPRLGEVLAALAQQPAFWFGLGLSFLLTFARSGFLAWTPMFLAEVTGKVQGGIVKSAIFPAAAVVSALAVGRYSDRLGPGRRAPVMTVMLALLTVAVLVLAHYGTRSAALAFPMIGVCGLMLLGPYSLLGGAVSLDVAGKTGAATAAGLVDGVGYLGGSLAGILMGFLAKRWGWAAAFYAIAVAALLGALLAAVWSRLSMRRAIG